MPLISLSKILKIILNSKERTIPTGKQLGNILWGPVLITSNPVRPAPYKSILCSAASSKAIIPIFGYSLPVLLQSPKGHPALLSGCPLQTPCRDGPAKLFLSAFCLHNILPCTENRSVHSLSSDRKKVPLAVIT